MLVEACVESFADAIAAEHAGVDRIELCANLSEGGTTPSSDLIHRVTSTVRIPVFAMIRPRGGDFVYSSEEIARMRHDIAAARSAGALGIVVGTLDASGRIDRVTLATLLEAAVPLPVTFHRAFDQTPDLDEALHDCQVAGVSRILTSGGAARAIDAVDTLRRLRALAEPQLEIVAGGGVRVDNVRQIIELSNVREIHLGPRRVVPLSTQCPSGDTISPDWLGLDVDALEAVMREVRHDAGRSVNPRIGGH